MQTVVLKLDIHDDDRCKRKAMKIVSTISGVDSISMNTKEQTLTLVGSMDPINLVSKLRKAFRTDVVSIGPVKELEKLKDEPQFTAYGTPYVAYNYNDYPTYPRYCNFYY